MQRKQSITQSQISIKSLPSGHKRRRATRVATRATCLLFACSIASLVDVVTIGLAVAEDESNSYHSGPSLLRASHHHQNHPQHGSSPSSPSSPSSKTGPATVQQPQISQSVDFLDWSLQVFGIATTSLKIETFEYYDYMRALSEMTDQFTEDDDDGIYYEDSNDDNTMESKMTSVEDYPRIHVRGLAASQDIKIGEVVIRIPYQALLTVSNLIDRDPVLSRVIGKKARRKYGWDNMGVEEEPADPELQQEELEEDDNEEMVHYYYELPLLAVALLHHVKLGPHSSMAPYIQLLQTSPVEYMPHIWNSTKLRQDASEAVRRVARSIQRDVREMYTQVVQVLINDHPNLFANPNRHRHMDEDRGEEDISYSDDDDEDEIDEDDDEVDVHEEWFFSFERFQWAFALVNSRHFHLPIPPSVNAAASAASETNHQARRRNKASKHENTEGSDNNGAAMDSPPASMPTEEWIQQQKNDDEDKRSSSSNKTDDDIGDDGEYAGDNDNDEFDLSVIGSSFLAPVADLLNFGPPCTRGRYNTGMQSFDIIATCNLAKGQEITFWYNGDACDDVILANYGFTHPMVPKCPTLQDWRRRAEIYKEQVHHLQSDLSNAYDDLDRIDSELDRVQQILYSCGDCCGDDMKTKIHDSPSADGDSRRADNRIPTPRASQRYPPSPHFLRSDEAPNGATNILQRGGSGPSRPKLPNRKSDRGL